MDALGHHDDIMYCNWNSAEPKAAFSFYHAKHGKDYEFPEPRSMIHPRCTLCWKKISERITCTTCGVVDYCSTEHRNEHQGNHKAVCDKVEDYMTDLITEQGFLKRATSQDVLERAKADPVHHGLVNSHAQEGKRYMMTLLRNTALLGAIQTCTSLEEQLRFARESLTYNQWDNYGNMEIVMTILLRMGKDQECYEFTKAIHIAMSNGTRLIEPTAVEAARGANACEVISRDSLPGFTLRSAVVLLLLKINLFLDVQHVKKSEFLLGRLPPEMADLLCSYTLRTQIIRDDLNKGRGSAGTENLFNLICDIRRIFMTVHNWNVNVWPTLLMPDDCAALDGLFNLNAKYLTPHTIKQFICRAWLEYPDALAYLKYLVDELIHETEN